jgi:hypothetical protein
MSAAPFDPLQALRALDRHRVRFVLIGGLAARLLGSPSVTNDLDICHDRERDNLDALAAALRELGARLRGVPDEVPFLLDGETLRRGDHFTFSTSAGALDLLGTPAGSGGFELLRRNALPLKLGDVEVLVADLPDLIHMKTAAGRPKDLIEVEILSALLEEREG